MRVTIYLFAKTGALKEMLSIPVEDINDVNSKDGHIVSVIPDYHTPNIWSKDPMAITLPSTSGWVSAKRNNNTGEYAIVIFYKGKA